MRWEIVAPRSAAAEVVRRFGGRAGNRDILRFATEHQLRTALDRGELLRASRGIYILADLPEPAAVAARCRAVLSHDSAAQHWRLDTVFPPGQIHVTARRGAKPPPQPAVVVHRAHLREDEVDGGATTPIRTVLDCARSMPFREALAVADSAARRHPGFESALREAAEVQPARGRRRCLRVAQAVSALADNPFESALRGTLLEAGLTGFAPQVPIRTASGIARVDLADVGHRIIAEADSFEWHGGRQALAADCRRYDELIRAGWAVYRFSWEDVMFDPGWVAEVVRDAVTAAPTTRRRAPARRTVRAS